MGGRSLPSLHAHNHNYKGVDVMVANIDLEDNQPKECDWPFVVADMKGTILFNSFGLNVPSNIL